MTTVGEALNEAFHILRQAGVGEARLDARLIVAHALGWAPERVFGHPEHTLAAHERDRIRALVERRRRREPLALITGEKEFWSLSFAVSPATLIPRPDSETLIEAVLAAFPDRRAPYRILDFGTGSGCLLLALLGEYENASGLGTDRSADALDMARLNARRLGLEKRAVFETADWRRDAPPPGAFDIIVANPPYVPEGDKAGLEPEVAEHEPHGALFAGPDGLDDYRLLVPMAAGLLADGGGLFFEVGLGQADAVAGLLERARLTGTARRDDLAGIPRCVWGKR